MEPWWEVAGQAAGAGGWQHYNMTTSRCCQVIGPGTLEPALAAHWSPPTLLITVHADPGRSRPGFSKIYTPHNLLPQQNVREEAIVYCQSINNLDCWHKTDWSVKCLTIPHLKFCTRICSFVRGRETSLCFTYNHIMCFRLKDDKWIIPSVEVDCLNGECLKWQINYFLQILSDALGHIKT